MGLFVVGSFANRFRLVWKYQKGIFDHAAKKFSPHDIVLRGLF